MVCMKDKLFFLFRTAVFLTAFLLVAYATIAFGGYLGEFRDIYFKTGQYDKMIGMLVIVLLLGYVLRKLLLLVYAKEAGITHSRRKRK